MNSTKQTRATRVLRWAVRGVVLAPLAVPAAGLAQQGNTSPGAKPASEPAGLNALSDERLLAELAQRGLDTLLNQALQADNLPKSQRDAWLTARRLRDLGDRSIRLTSQQRQQIIHQAVAQLDQTLANIHDARAILQQATLLSTYGAERDVNALEYWGPSTRTQASLRPVAEAAIKLLQRSAELADQEASRIAAGFGNNPSPQQIAAWTAADNLATAARYHEPMIEYYLCLAIDPADPQRRQVAQKAIADLRQYDNPDSQVQPIVRARMAKLLITAGDYPAARDLFRTLTDEKTTVKPLPDPAEQFEARYFAAQCDLLERKPDAAQKSLDALVQWQQSSGVLRDQQTRDGAQAACDMLQYRIHSLRADLATSHGEKTQANADATTVLMALVERRPDLRWMVYDQLITRLPDNAELTKLDPLLLQAILQRGDQERLKPEGEDVDRQAIQRAVDAANELMRRQGQPGVSDRAVSTAALLSGALLDRLGRSADAAGAFLDYIEKREGTAQDKTAALEYALAIIDQLRKQDAADPATVRLYERVLPIAINKPFERKALAFEYARRLQQLGRYKDAIAYYRQVPADDKRLLHARFYEVLAMKQQLDAEGAAMDGTARQRLLDDVARRADEVEKTARAGMASSTPSPEDLRTSRLIVIKTTLLAAEMSRETDPTRTLRLLEGFEELVKGQTNENDLLASALFLRVHSYMVLNRGTEATQSLLALLKTKPGGEGAGIVYALLKQLDADFDEAQAAGNTNQMRALANARAQLSGHLVEWARTNPDPKIAKYTYRYQVFDAATKQQAAMLEPDPQKRQAMLEQSLKLYQSLQSPENEAIYRETMDASPAADDEANYGDPVVMLNIALVQFELGNWQAAQAGLGQLLNDRRLGAATTVVEENGEEQTVDNDQYWEATCRWMLSTIKLGRPDEIANVQNALRRLYITWGNQTGGRKWHATFEQLRREQIPDLKIEP